MNKVNFNTSAFSCFLPPAFGLQFMMICIKVADISNEARPMDVSEPWIDCLLQEFFNQVCLPDRGSIFNNFLFDGMTFMGRYFQVWCFGYDQVFLVSSIKKKAVNFTVHRTPWNCFIIGNFGIVCNFEIQLPGFSRELMFFFEQFLVLGYVLYKLEIKSKNMPTLLEW